MCCGPRVKVLCETCADAGKSYESIGPKTISRNEILNVPAGTIVCPDCRSRVRAGQAEIMIACLAQNPTRRQANKMKMFWFLFVKWQLS